MEPSRRPLASAQSIKTVAELLAQHAPLEALGVPAQPPGGMLGLAGHLETQDAE